MQIKQVYSLSIETTLVIFCLNVLNAYISFLFNYFFLQITSEDQEWYFNQAFQDNKPQCLLFSRHIFPPLLYLSVAYEYRSKVKFVYIDVKDLRTERLREKYTVNKFDPTIVMLKEEPSSPVEIVRVKLIMISNISLVSVFLF